MRENEPAIDSIYFKLQKSKTLHSYMEPVLETLDQQHLREFRMRFGDSRLARSENLVDPVDILRLNVIAGDVRNGIFREGNPSVQDPLYREWVREGLISEQDAYKLFYVKGRGTVIKAELDYKEESLGMRLAITSKEPNRIVDLGLDFLDGYWLTVEYGDPASPNYAEYMVYNSLIDMTEEEYSIFSDYMRRARVIIDEKP
jgi:hypothetical protein